ncbi:MAG: flagellar hook basal-body protein [Bacteroidota bacterium]|nr:flagellar hook basal-body protein [Candidatus Kapabacteria bacterium]MDW8271196.1 flagellar hook basal-body protein [Bacteroidota bacterium]
MLKELYTAALGMLPQQVRLELTAHNIANANTVGYKRSGIFEQTLIEARENLLNVRGDAEVEDTPLRQYIDFQQGALQKTGNPLDIALDGNTTFFVVADRDGQEYLTRAGHFTIDSQGYVVTSDGKMLLTSGGPLRIELPQQGDNLQGDNLARQIQISPNGEVQFNGLMVGQLRVVQVANPQSLQRANAVTFLPTDETDIADLSPEEIHIQQGYLEASNVNIVTELVTMIQLQRMFELGQKVIQTNDGTLDRSIDIGRFSS